MIRALLLLLLALPLFAGAQETDTYDGAIAAFGDGLKENLAFRKVHDAITEERAAKRAYEKMWDLSDLPHYVPGQQVFGTLRVSGIYLVQGQVADLWKREFAKFQPGVTLVTVARGDLASGEIDIQTGPRMNDRIGEISEFERKTGHAPLEIDWATGAYDLPGWSPAFTIFVHKDSPLPGLTMAQLDGIFGGARSGGWAGTRWNPAVARGPEKNIRRWSQLGLSGAWADQPIHVLGRPLKYNIQLGFERKVFQGGDLWNEELREYAHELNPDGTRYTSSVEMVKDLGKDPYGICFADLGSLTDAVRALPLAAEPGGPFVPLTLDTLRERRYPLFLEQWAYIDQAPGEKLRPIIREFLAFMLSREGQEAIQQDGKWLPLPAQVVEAQRARLDSVGPAALGPEAGLQLPLVDPKPGAGESVDELGRTDPRKSYYDKRWDLSGLPDYSPGAVVSGIIRLPAEGQIWESSVGQAWIDGFSRFHPGVRFDKGDGAPADVSIGRKWTTYFGGEMLAYQLKNQHSPLEIQVATGAYDVPGWSPAIVIYVNKDNPIRSLTLAQLDGIFGGPRRGGWAGTAWRRQVGRGPETDIRRWGDLGLTGDWANLPITVYGRPTKYHLMSVLERKVLQGGNMWNDSLREYASAPGAAAPVEIMKALAADRSGITFAERGYETPDVKALAIAPYHGGMAVEPSLSSVRDRAYPLGLEVYAYAVGKPDPKVREFLLYILSRQGQEAVERDGKWLPLTAELVRAQRAKLGP